MKYLTTKCANCGYATRKHESGVPSIQIGMPVLPCPRCGHFILDSVQVEYEFMTDKEKSKFSTQSALLKSYLINAIFIVAGAIFLIWGMVDQVLASLIPGVGCLALGIFQIVKNQKMARNEIIEQFVYESLKRTSNNEYVEFLQSVYERNGIKRKFSPYVYAKSFMKQYKKFESRVTFIENMNYFENFLELINTNTNIKQNDVSIFLHH